MDVQIDSALTVSSVQISGSILYTGIPDHLLTSDKFGICLCAYEGRLKSS